MKKLNNHGLTAVEVIICFSITAVIVISLFKTISNYNDKQYLESVKNQITTYRSMVTKTIQDDVIENGGLKYIYTPEGHYKKEGKAFNDTYIEDAYQNGEIGIELQFHNDKNGILIISINDNYIEYQNSNKQKEKFPLSDIGDDVEFNEPRIDYDEDNGILNVYVGINHSDLGDKYAALDVMLPLTSKWSQLYKTE